MDKNASRRRERLAAELQAILKESRLSQVGLARVSGVSRETVKLMIGEQQIPKSSTLRLLADGAATDGAENLDAAKADSYYDRLMRAAGYIEDRAAEPSAPDDEMSLRDIQVKLAETTGQHDVSFGFVRVAKNRDKVPPDQWAMLELAVKAAEKSLPPDLDP